jgi:hypothetical protein
MKVKAGQEIIDTISLAYKADRPVLLEGAHGIGKSELILQAADKLGIDCIVRDLSLLEPPDLIGLPFREKGRTVYAPPMFLPTGGKGILVFEELNRSEKYMMSPCLQLLTARCLNDYKLPGGWLPIAAINPASEGYDVRPLDPALLSRFARLQVAPDVRGWLLWAKSHGIHESVRRYVELVPDIFASTNPRAWEYVSDFVIANGGTGASGRRVLLALIAGVVDETHAKAFIKECTGIDDAPVSVDAVLRKYRSVQRKVQSWAKAKRTDQLASIAHAVQVALQGSDLCDEISRSARMQKNLQDFVKDLPGDFGKKVQRAAKQGGAL